LSSKKRKVRKSVVKPIRVSLGERSYDILVGNGLLGHLGYYLGRLKDVSNVVVVTNPHIASYHISKLRGALLGTNLNYEVHLVPDGEIAKSEEVLFNIYRHLLRFRADRGTVLVALGGGVIGDVGGFAASTFMRGIRLVHVPTTLLGQVDSAIGGKTAINMEEGKNLIGTFFQPSLVICDIALLKTLPTLELSASLAEVIKYGLIKGESFFRYLENHVEKLLVGDTAVLEKVVRVSAEIKASIVGRDERETKGLRVHLNLGHTFAHAFEREGGYKKVSHGRAVAVGLVTAVRLSEAKGWVRKDFRRRVTQLVSRAQLPTHISELGLHAKGVLASMVHDKKKRKGTLRFVLPRGLGRLVVTDQVTPALLRKVLK